MFKYTMDRGWASEAQSLPEGPWVINGGWGRMDYVLQ